MVFTETAKAVLNSTTLEHPAEASLKRGVNENSFARVHFAVPAQKASKIGDGD
jgi:hypothetical protein